MEATAPAAPLYLSLSLSISPQQSSVRSDTLRELSPRGRNVESRNLCLISEPRTLHRCGTPQSLGSRINIDDDDSDGEVNDDIAVKTDAVVTHFLRSSLPESGAVRVGLARFQLFLPF